MSDDLQLALTLRFNGSAVDRGLRNMNRQFSRTYDRAISGSRRLTRDLSRLNQQINGFSTASRLAGAAGLTLSLNNAVGGVVELEKAMLKAKSNLISGAKDAKDLNRQLQAVRNTGREISKQSILSDADGVMLQTELMKAGVDSKFISGKKGVGVATAALSQIGGLNPEAAAESVGKAGNQFSFKSAKQYTDYINSLIKSADASAASPGSILYNTQQSGATAAQLGIDPNKLNAIFGYLDPLGNQAGTAMNRFLKGLGGTTPRQRKAIKSSGLDFWQKNKDGSTTLKDINEIFDLVSNKFKSMKDDQKKLQLAQKMFGEEGARVAALLSSKDETFESFHKRMQSATGTVEKLKIEMSGLGASFTRLKNNLFSRFDKNFTPVRTQLTKGVNAVNDGVDDGNGLQMAVGGAGALIAARLAYKRLAGGKGIGGMVKGMMGGGGMQRVFVTNWPRGMLSPTEQYRQQGASNGGGAASTTPAKSKASKLSRAKSGLGGAFKYGAPLAVVMGATEAMSAYSDNSMSQQAKKKAYSQAAGGTAGSVVGGVIGGGIGALFGGVGAVPGALIGSAIGDSVGRIVAEHLSKVDDKPIHIENRIETHVDSEKVAEKVEKKVIGHARRYD